MLTLKQRALFFREIFFEMFYNVVIIGAVQVRSKMFDFQSFSVPYIFQPLNLKGKSSFKVIAKQYCAYSEEFFLSLQSTTDLRTFLFSCRIL